RRPVECVQARHRGRVGRGEGGVVQRYSTARISTRLIAGRTSQAMTPPAPEAPVVSPARKWAITFTVMVVAFMQILDTSVTNVILPHLQGSLSAGPEAGAWGLTSHTG